VDLESGKIINTGTLDITPNELTGVTG
jgi:hypothetical protein